MTWYDLRRSLYGEGWEEQSSGIMVPPGSATPTWTSKPYDFDPNLTAEECRQMIARFLLSEARAEAEAVQQPKTETEVPAWYKLLDQ